MRLNDRIAIVTGGARGIGSGISQLFAQEGAKVVIWDVIDTGQDIARGIIGQGGTATFQQVDISNRDQVNDAVKAIINEYGRIDILINNAGIIRDRTIIKMTYEEWDDVIRVNLTGTFNVTKAVLPSMRQSGYGRIVNASSINGVLGAFGQTNYAATKAGIIGFTKALAKEVGKYGITANAIAPGFIKTAMTDSMPQDVIDAGIRQIPVRRIGTPKDMAEAYLFLASSESGFINGHVLHANGGAF